MAADDWEEVPAEDWADVQEPGAAAAPSGSGPSRAEAFFRGAGQGATLGLGDEINGLVQALGERYLPESMGGGGPQAQARTFGDLYRGNRDAFRRDNASAETAHGGAYLGGNILGGLPITTALPSFGAASKGAGYAKLAKSGALAGILQGGISGIGGGLADMTRSQFGPAGGEVLFNAAGGGALGGALGPVPKLLGALAPNLQQFAYRRAVKAAGPMLKDIRALQRGGRLESVGKKLMDMGLIPTGAGVEEIANIVDQAAQKRGADVHTILGELDALTPAATPQLGGGVARPVEITPNGLTRLPPALEGRPLGDLPGSLELRAASGTVNQRVPGVVPPAEDLPGFNPALVGLRARAELLKPLRDQPALQGLIPGLQSQIENLEALGSRRLAFTRANDVKRGYDQLLDWDKEQTPAKELLKQLRGLVNEEIEKGADAAAAQTGNEGLVGRFRSAKQDYRDLRQVADFAQDQVSRREANRFISPSDYGMGIASGLAGVVSGHHTLGALMGLAGAAGNKLARERGNSVAANASLSLAQWLSAQNGVPMAVGRAIAPFQGRGLARVTLADLLAGAIPNRNSQTAELLGAVP